MRTKDEILAELREGLESGALTEADIKTLIAKSPEKTVENERKPGMLSAVDIMFYIAGIVLFSAVMSSIMLSWDPGNALVNILMSAVLGVALWGMAYTLMRSAEQSDVRRGLTNSLLMTGSLLIVVGGYIITNEIVGGYNEINFLPFAVTLLIIGGIHISFDKIIKRNLILLMGVLLATVAFPSLMFGILQDADLPSDVVSVVMVASAGLLAYATRVVGRMHPERKLNRSFDSFAAFVAMISMYFASYGEYSILWFGALIGSILGVFYLSIVLQNKHLLGSASFFMVLTIITISFKYFSGFGVTFSLVAATVGLLGSAAIASNINKKYFK